MKNCQGVELDFVCGIFVVFRRFRRYVFGYILELLWVSECYIFFIILVSNGSIDFNYFIFVLILYVKCMGESLDQEFWILRSFIYIGILCR